MTSRDIVTRVRTFHCDTLLREDENVCEPNRVSLYSPQARRVQSVTVPSSRDMSKIAEMSFDPGFSRTYTWEPKRGSLKKCRRKVAGQTKHLIQQLQFVSMLQCSFSLSQRMGFGKDEVRIAEKQMLQLQFLLWNFP